MADCPECKCAKLRADHAEERRDALIAERDDLRERRARIEAERDALREQIAHLEAERDAAAAVASDRLESLKILSDRTRIQRATLEAVLDTSRPIADLLASDWPAICNETLACYYAADDAAREVLRG